MFTCKTTKIDKEKHWGNVRRVFSGAGILGIFLKYYAPPDGTDGAAKRQCEIRNLRGCEVLWRVWDLLVNQIDVECRIEKLSGQRFGVNIH